MKRVKSVVVMRRSATVRSTNEEMDSLCNQYRNGRGALVVWIIPQGATAMADIIAISYAPGHWWCGLWRPYTQHEQRSPFPKRLHGRVFMHVLTNAFQIFFVADDMIVKIPLP